MPELRQQSWNAHKGKTASSGKETEDGHPPRTDPDDASDEEGEPVSGRSPKPTEALKKAADGTTARKRRPEISAPVTFREYFRCDKYLDPKVLPLSLHRRTFRCLSKLLFAFAEEARLCDGAA